MKAVDPWMLAEDIPDSDIFFFQIPMTAFTSDTSYPFIKNYKRVLTHYKGFHMYFYFAERDSFEVAESILKALKDKPWFGKDLNKNVVTWSYKLIDFAQTTAKLPLRKFSNRQLWELYNQHDRVHTKLYTYGWLPVSVDMFHNNLTKALKSYLYGICSSKAEAEQAFLVLTTPSKKSIIAKEREEFLAIYTKYIKDLKHFKRAPLVLKRKLDKHVAAWRHMGYIYAGNVKPLDQQHYFKELQDLAKSKISAQSILRKEASQLKRAKTQQAQLFNKLKISRQYKNLFVTAQDFALTKLVRRHAQLLDLYLMHTTLLTEMARRLKLTRYQIQFMLKDEVRAALVGGKKPNKTVLKQRLKQCVLYTERNVEVVYVGAKAKSMTKNLGRLFERGQKEVFGQIAQPGFAIGKVKIIIRASDMKKFNKGDILVSIATDPDIVPAMKKAAAIVTEQGGITSHAAIVSRELGTPCVIGTQVATKIFKDGDMVEVDANKGIVKIVNKK